MGLTCATRVAEWELPIVSKYARKVGLQCALRLRIVQAHIDAFQEFIRIKSLLEEEPQMPPIPEEILRKIEAHIPELSKYLHFVRKERALGKVRAQEKAFANLYLDILPAFYDNQTPLTPIELETLAAYSIRGPRASRETETEGMKSGMRKGLE